MDSENFEKRWNFLLDGQVDHSLVSRELDLDSPLQLMDEWEIWVSDGPALLLFKQEEDGNIRFAFCKKTMNKSGNIDSDCWKITSCNLRRKGVVLDFGLLQNDIYSSDGMLDLHHHRYFVILGSREGSHVSFEVLWIAVPIYSASKPTFETGESFVLGLPASISLRDSEHITAFCMKQQPAVVGACMLMASFFQCWVSVLDADEGKSSIFQLRSFGLERKMTIPFSCEIEVLAVPDCGDGCFRLALQTSESNLIVLMNGKGDQLVTQLVLRSVGWFDISESSQALVAIQATDSTGVGAAVVNILSSEAVLLDGLEVEFLDHRPNTNLLKWTNSALLNFRRKIASLKRRLRWKDFFLKKELNMISGMHNRCLCQNGLVSLRSSVENALTRYVPRFGCSPFDVTPKIILNDVSILDGKTVVAFQEAPLQGMYIAALNHSKCVSQSKCSISTNRLIFLENCNAQTLRFFHGDKGDRQCVDLRIPEVHQHKFQQLTYFCGPKMLISVFDEDTIESCDLQILSSRTTTNGAIELVVQFQSNSDLSLKKAVSAVQNSLPDNTLFEADFDRQRHLFPIVDFAGVLYDETIFFVTQVDQKMRSAAHDWDRFLESGIYRQLRSDAASHAALSLLCGSQGNSQLFF
eukprot:TRINITY_DN14163_c0_g1_i1.p1 TRINITY_DN14163_c0_g1~~TRINITY_DN14163_c0_g1_i1.p1  ORF type:complete len:707 (+),score=151.68 TRINITY_DN14163_c0_g1_i1:216-2123(+)